ncbi:MAG: pseudouridine synthase, partial [Verrucomicrobiota bacterium]
MTLDRFLAKHLGLNRRDARCLLFQRQVTVNGAAVSHHLHPITPFDQIQLDGQLLQQGQARLYFALHKPVGYVSATTDPLHPTVLDLLDHPEKKNLHLAGRLDRSSSGLVLLTNDGHWSEAITRPAEKLEKEYLVETLDPIPPSAIARFAEGFYFPTENIHTQPASLTRLST